MKTFRTTFVLAVLVGAVVGYTVWDFNKNKENKKSEETKDQIFHIQSDDVVRLEIQRPKNTLVLEKQGNEWKLSSPVQDRANGSGVDSLISALISQKVKVADLEGAQPNWKDYHLDPPTITVKFGLKGGASHAVSVSEQAAFDGSYFLRREGDGKLLVGETTWKGQVNKNANDLRDKAIFPKGKDPVSLSLWSKGKKLLFQLEKKDGKWMFAKNKDWKIDSSAVNKWVSEVKDLKISDFVSEESGSKQLKEFGLKSPEKVLKVQFAAGEKNNSAASKDSSRWELKVSAIKDGGAHLITSGRPTIYKAFKSYIEKLDKVAEDFRDKKYPFEFDQGKAHELTLKGAPTNEIQLVKKGGQWSLKQPLPGKEVNDGEVRKLLREISDLKVSQFVDGRQASQKVSKGDKRLMIKDEKGESIFDLVWGEKLKVTEGKGKTGKKSLYLVKTSLANEVLGLDMASLDKLPVQKVLKDKPAPKEKPVSSKSSSSEKEATSSKSTTDKE